MSRRRANRQPSFEKLAIELGMVTFLVVMIVASYLTLGRSARLVPLIVAYPTLALVCYQLAADLGWIDRLRRREPPSAEGVRADLEAAMRVLDEDAGESEDVEMRRYVVFGLWATGFIVLAALTSFLVAVPVALFLIQWDANRSVGRALYVTVPTSLVLYLIFDTFLQIPW